MSYNFKFKDLIPIYGSVSIESKPARAAISIDGKEYGTTPMFIPELIIGTHYITLTLTGYENKHSTFSVTEGNQTDLFYELSESINQASKINQVPNTNHAPNVQSTVNSNKQPTKGNSEVKSNNSKSNNSKTNNKSNNSKKKYGSIDMDKVLTSLPQYINLQKQIQNKTNNGENSNDIETFRKTELDKIYAIVNQAIQKVSLSYSIEIVIPNDLPLYIGSDVIDITENVIKTIKN